MHLKSSNYSLDKSKKTLYYDSDRVIAILV